MDNMTMVWATEKALKERVADVPGNWLERFMAARPNDIRKFGTAKNSRLMYRVAAVLDAIEAGEFFREAAEGNGAA